MAEAFDSYRKWLGIPPEEQPPNHYRLLGVALYETDPDVISNAADRQMAHIRTFQSGPYARFSQRLLNELAAARVCLLHRQQRDEYDAWLRHRYADAPATDAPAMDVPQFGPDQEAAELEARLRVAALPTATPVRSTATSAPAAPDLPPLSRPVSRRSDPTLGIAIGVGAIAVAAVLGLVIWMANTPGPSLDGGRPQSGPRSGAATPTKKRSNDKTGTARSKTKSEAKSESKEPLPDRSISPAKVQEGDLGPLPDWKTSQPPKE